MSANILKTLNKDNGPSLQFSTDVSQTVNNNTNEKISATLDIEVDDPHNFNSRSTLVSDDIPFIQLNNTLDQEEPSLMFPDMTTEEVMSEEEFAVSVEQLQRQRRFENSIISRTRIKYESVIKNGDIVAVINKPVGFNGAVQETVNRRGMFKLYDENGALVHTETNIVENLFNWEIINYILSDEANSATGITKLNIESLKHDNNIPIKVTGNKFRSLEEYNLNTFVVKIPITAKNNILKKIVKEPPTSRIYSKESLTYELNFSIFFDIEIVDTFPVEFVWVDGSSEYSSNNKLLTSMGNHSVTIDGISPSEQFYQNCMDGEYGNLYLIFR